MALLKCVAPCVIASVMALAFPVVSKATLINATVTSSDPLHWSGYVDWTTPASVSNITIGLATNWSVGVVEVPIPGGLGVLVVTVQHLVAPHEPPSPAGLILSGAYGPILPGTAGAAQNDQEPHPDNPDHMDTFNVTLTTLNSTTSRLTINVQHTDDAVIPEPSTLSLVGAAACALVVRRWRRSP